MPEGMPYTIEKGPYLSVIEDFVNAGPVNRTVAALGALRGGASIAGMPPLHSPAVASSRWPNDELVKHVKADWFGWRPLPPAEPTEPQPHFDERHNPTTGFWRYWYGDAEPVLRQTLIRALEVCLGLDHDSDPADPSDPPRRWYLELFWKCPQPWFEGWVTWRRHGNGRREGQVTTIFSTPGHGDPLVPTPVRDPDATGPEYQLDPTSATGRQGMWVVSQEHHRSWVPKKSTAPSAPGQWTPPVVHHESTGPVVVVAPAEQEGGVRPDGRPYEGGA